METETGRETEARTQAGTERGIARRGETERDGHTETQMKRET